MNAANKMQNALRIMMSLDEVADVIGRDAARDFHLDPLRAACRMDEATWARVFALIEARQPSLLQRIEDTYMTQLRRDAQSDDGTRAADAYATSAALQRYARAKGRL